MNNEVKTTSFAELVGALNEAQSNLSLLQISNADDSIAANNKISGMLDYASTLETVSSDLAIGASVLGSLSMMGLMLFGIGPEFIPQLKGIKPAVEMAGKWGTGLVTLGAGGAKFGNDFAKSEISLENSDQKSVTAVSQGFTKSATNVEQAMSSDTRAISTLVQTYGQAEVIKN